MLKCLKFETRWNGSEFFGYTEHTEQRPINWRFVTELAAS